MPMRLMNLVAASLAALRAAQAATSEFYVCNDVADSTYSGTYELGDDHSGKPTWTNEFGKSIFAHGEFWCVAARRTCA